MSSFRKQIFFFSSLGGRGAFRMLCITTETMRNGEFYPSWSSFLPLHSTKTHTHALFLSNCWSLLQLHACSPVCLFLEALNMADMCFVIVGTSSSFLAYKGLVISQATTTTPTEATNQPFLKEINKSSYQKIGACGGVHNDTIGHFLALRLILIITALSRTHHLMMMAIWNICFLKKGTERSL